jgi:hypothetical protein
VPLREGCLWEWFWDGDNEETQMMWTERQWAFTIPLVELNDENDLLAQIINPVLALFDGRSPNKAFNGANKVMRFEFDKDNRLKIKKKTIS